MKELNDFVRENKEGFSPLKATDASWLKIKAGMFKDKPIPKPRKSPIFYLMRIAAAVLFMVFAVGIYTNGQTNEPDFNAIKMDSPDGVVVPLDPSKNKLTLVQFWETGNVICSENNCYYYLPAYEKYKDKGFEIYAISLDRDKDTWLQGIEENELPWIHVSDLLGWQSPICVECNISKVPTSILIDNEGKIVDRDLEAHQLEERLEELLASTD